MKFTPRSEETRRFIIEATAGIFNTKGYAGTSLSDLTEATQLTKGSIYGNFANKEEVALAVFDYTIARRDKVVAECLSKATTYKDKLLAFVNAFSTTHSQAFVKGGCPLLNAGTEADDTFEPLRKKVAKAMTDMKKEVEALISGGIAAGEFRAAINPEQSALALIALIEGGIFLGRTLHKSAYLDSILESARNLVHQMAVD